MSKTISVSKARESFGDLIGKVARRRTRCVITSKGSPRAVLISHAEYESWNATLGVLSNSKELQSIERGLAELKAGQSLSFEEVFGEPLNGSECQTGQVLPHRS